MIPKSLTDTINTLLPSLDGWVTPQRGIELAELILEHKPSVLVEIGCFGARSTIAQGLALKQLGAGKLYTIDPWKREDAVEGENGENARWWGEAVNLEAIHARAMQAIWSQGLDEFIIVIRAASQNANRLFPVIHFLGIDGNHSELASCRDVALYLPHLVVGGLLWFDDSDWPSTQAALRMISEHCELVKDGATYRIYRKVS